MKFPLSHKINVAEKYYLSNRNTLIIPFVFMSISLLVLLQGNDSVSMIKNISMDDITSFFRSAWDINADFFELSNSKLILILSASYSVAIVVMLVIFNFISGTIKKKYAQKIAKTNGKLEFMPPPIPEDTKNKEAPSFKHRIPRKELLEKLGDFIENFPSKKNNAFIVGKSGIGKSLLMKDYEESKGNVALITDYNSITQKTLIENFIENVSEKRIKGIPIVIFDQFERAIANEPEPEPEPEHSLEDENTEEDKHNSEDKENRKQTIRWIKDILKNKEIRFIFVCKDEGLSRVLEIFASSVTEYQSFFFEKAIRDISKNESDVIKEYWEKEIITKRNYENKKQFIENICLMYQNETLRMIEISILMSYFEMLQETEESKDIENILDYYSNGSNVKKLLESYFDILFSASTKGSSSTSCSATEAMIMVYSLCCDRRFGRFYGLCHIDFKNIAFMKDFEIGRVLDVFTKQNIIKKVYIDDSNRYILSHDYLVYYLDSYCEKYLHPQIVSNVRYYCHEVIGLDIDGNQVDTRIDHDKNCDNTVLSKYCSAFVDDESTVKIVNYSMIALTIALAITVCHVVLRENALYLCDADDNHKSIMFEVFSRYSLAILAVGCSAYYVYHHLLHFTRIFLSFKETEYQRFLLSAAMILCNSIAVVLSLLYQNWWAAWTSIGFITVGLMHKSISEICHENVRDLFRKEGTVFITIACIIIFLNFIVYYIMNQDMHSWYLVYTAFMLLTIRQHINTDYMLSKLGSLSYPISSSGAEHS